MHPDPDAIYERVVDIDVSALEPIVVVPPSPANTRDLSEHLGLEVHTGYLGSCASGRLEDLRAAAEVLRGRQVKPGFQLHVVPTSQAIMAQAAREGLIERLVEAGAFISSPSCDYCFGRIATMADEPARGLDRHAEHAGPHGQRRFRDLPVQRRGGRRRPRSKARIADPRRYLLERATQPREPARPRRLRLRRGRLRRRPDHRRAEHQDPGRRPSSPRSRCRSYDPDFAAKVQRGDVLVGGAQFRLRPSALSADARHAPSRHRGRDRRSRSRPATGAARSAWAFRR